MNVMAPLVVGDPHDVTSGPSRADWRKFRRHLKEMKRLGVESVSTDVWWGLFEPTEGNFDWHYYDKLSSTIISAGLKWVPILSFHRCGGNVGDTTTVHVPSWVWKKVKLLAGVDSVEAVKYVSEQGNSSDEYVSAWATEFAISLYENAMVAFQNHYADKADSIAEINVSLGPAGELRYPSYNNHDKGTDYPTRGALQCYSDLAVDSFKAFAMDKYGDAEGVDEAWGTDVAGGQEILPPSNPSEFFLRFDHHDTQYGKDFFDWYHGSLLSHGEVILTKAVDIFGASDSAFRGIDIGAKIPGVHWMTGKRTDTGIEVGSRLAELAAGLIRTSAEDWKEEGGFGYSPIISMFSNLGQYAEELDSESDHNRVVLHFTCLEMPDGEDGPRGKSIARTLVTCVGNEAQSQDVPIKGENALWWNLANREAWKRMRSHLEVAGTEGAYEGITILRMTHVADDSVANDEMSRTVSYVNGDEDESSSEEAA